MLPDDKLQILRRLEHHSNRDPRLVLAHILECPSRFEVHPSSALLPARVRKSNPFGLYDLPENGAVRIIGPSGPCMISRHSPPGRTSITSIVVVKPRGPHQFTTCFALVHASHTSSRGASNTRNITQSPSLSTWLWQRLAISCGHASSPFSSLRFSALVGNHPGDRSSLPKSGDTRPPNGQLLSTARREAGKASTAPTVRG